jgi:hypothetical protein
MNQPSGIRRVVTTHAADGRSIVAFDSEIGPYAHEPLKTSGVRQFVLWLTDETPADVSGSADVAQRKVSIPPPKNGSIFRIVEFPPTPPAVDKLPLDHMEKILGDAHIHSKFPSRHPFMHRTATIDYIIVMYGEIDLLLDDSEVHLKAGDVLIQRSTNHSWVNRSKDVCRLGIVLLESNAVDQV